jgi:perosamine synthetase
LADATCFRFHPRKIITMGEGGMITTDREDIARACRSFKAFGSDGKRFLQVGTNLKLPDILAAIGLEQMKRLERIIRIRAQKARIYEELLGEARHVRTPIQRKGTRHTFQTYTVYFERPRIRDRVIRALARRNIESRIASYAIHQQPAFKKLRRSGDLANSRLLYERALALPLHHRITDEDQQLVCKIVTRIGKS